MGDLTPHFDRREFACRCGCGKADIAPALTALLEDIREKLGRPVIVTSGVRCAAHNERVGGVPGSAHLTGHAADLHAPDDQLRFALVELALAAGCARVGVAKTFVHLDCAPHLPAPRLWLYG